MKLNQNIFWQVKIGFRFFLVTIFGIQCVLSFVKLMSGGRDLVHLTFIDSGNNEEYRHPLYTVCPVLDPVSNFSDPDLTFQDVVFDTPYYPTVKFVSLANSPKLRAKKWSTWMKDRLYGEEVGGVQEVLLKCFTFDVSQTIELGTFESKLNLLLGIKEPTPYVFGTASIVKEFRIYIHSHQGYMNTFMLGNGRPSMIIPGYDRKSDETSVVMFHHFLINPYLIKEYEMAKCSPNVTETEECLEKYWKSKTSFKHCKIPWKMPNDDRSPCPPCFRNQTAGHEYCRLSFNISAAGASVNHCNRFSAEGDSCTDIYKRGLGGRNCTICDDGCKPFEKESLCIDKSALENFLKELPFPWQTEQILDKTGCKKPCQHMSFSVSKVLSSSSAIEIDPQGDNFAVVSLELSTESIRTVEKRPSYSWQDFIGDVGGNIGIFLGFSIIKLEFNPNSDGDLSLWIVPRSIMTLTAVMWCVTRYLEFDENRIRQEYIHMNNGNVDMIPPPYISICPIYDDRLFLPVSGFDKYKFSFEKFHINHRRNFISRRYPHKGSWDTKWKYYQDNFFQSIILGHQCFTYKPNPEVAEESKKITIELNTHRVEYFLGYLHDTNTLQHAFLHKSSVPLFYIPYNNSKLTPTALPNHYTFTVQSQTIHDFKGQTCSSSTPIDSNDQENCYIDTLEKRLGCSLKWIYYTNEASDCQHCQFPFVYNGTQYHHCASDGESQSWCATSVRGDRSIVDNEMTWQFCPTNCSANFEARGETKLSDCKSRSDLEHLVNIMFDRLQNNPDVIAKELLGMNCPFSCQYVSRSVVESLKRHDPRIGGSLVRLDFELSDIVDEGQDTVISDVEVTLDMFISDIGTAFGLLLGLSLLDIVRYTAATFYFSLQTFKTQGLTLSKNTIFTHGITLFWLMLAGLVGALIIAGLSKTFSSLVHNSDISSEGIDSSGFLNTDSDSVSWSVQDSLKNNANCPYPDDLSDSYCDDRANVPECQYDGGDCCSWQKDIRSNGHLFCTDCFCKDPFDQSQTKYKIKRGVCEVCAFPFTKTDNDSFGGQCNHGFNGTTITRSDCKYDCGSVECRFVCPIALDKDTGKPVGPPYDFACPSKEDGELYPTCLIDKFPKLYGKQSSVFIAKSLRTFYENFQRPMSQNFGIAVTKLP